MSKLLAHFVLLFIYAKTTLACFGATLINGCAMSLLTDDFSLSPEKVSQVLANDKNLQMFSRRVPEIKNYNINEDHKYGSGGLSCYDKQLIVDQHNRLRQMTALGQVRGQPPAANMLEMVQYYRPSNVPNYSYCNSEEGKHTVISHRASEHLIFKSWDEELARQAQAWADQCIFQHDSSRTRRVSRFPVGQNLAVTWTSPRPNELGPNPDFITQINDWFGEVYRFGYSGRFTHNTGHFSQLIWGDTYLVGCGYSYYLQGSRYTKLYVCNYGPGGNIQGAAPYRAGSPSCSLYGTSPSRSYYGLCEVKTFLANPCYYG